MSTARNFAICIGINRYRYIKPLSYAQNDAEAMERFFLETAKFDAVWLLSDPRNPLGIPDSANIRQAFRELQRCGLRASDNLWFFFSGHGMRHAGQDYLMPIEGNRDDVERTTISIAEVTATLSECGAENVILLLDACRSREDKDGEGIGRDTKQRAKRAGIVTFFSCQPNEFSLELEALQHGVFTRAVLDGLGGREKCATVERLNRYLKDRVPELLREHKHPDFQQTPEIAIAPLERQHLILLPDFADERDIERLKLDAYRAEVYEGKLELAREFWIHAISAVKGIDSEAFDALDRLRFKLSPPLTSFSFETVRLNPQGEVVERRPNWARCFTEELKSGVTLEMVEIPGGTFRMGAPKEEKGSRDSERPQHDVIVAPFYMGKYPVTQAQWRAIASLPKVVRDLELDPARFKGDNRPVEQVSWLDAQEFCRRLSVATERTYRLPSEAEWEYACRAGTTTPFYFGETITSEFVNFRGISTYADAPEGEFRKKTTEVGSFPANAFGLYDMHGNVCEWCEDDWHSDYEGAPTDGSAWLVENSTKNKKRLRGGSWINYPRHCRSAIRSYTTPDGAIINLGFRVVCAASRTLS